jgi:hypothetical protein
MCRFGSRPDVVQDLFAADDLENFVVPRSTGPSSKPSPETTTPDLVVAIVIDEERANTGFDSAEVDG